MSEQKRDPFDMSDLVEADGLLHDLGQVVKPTQDSSKTVPQIAAVEPEAPKSTEPSD